MKNYKEKTLLEVIRRACLKCTGNNTHLVNACLRKDSCPLHPYRLELGYVNPLEAIKLKCTWGCYDKRLEPCLGKACPLYHYTHRGRAILKKTLGISR